MRQSEPFVIAAAKLSVSIAGFQDALADVLEPLMGPTKLRGWAVTRREMAYQLFQRWPVSLGGSIPDDMYEEWMVAATEDIECPACDGSGAGEVQTPWKTNPCHHCDGSGVTEDE